MGENAEVLNVEMEAVAAGYHTMRLAETIHIILDHQAGKPTLTRTSTDPSAYGRRLRSRRLAGVGIRERLHCVREGNIYV